MKKSRKINIFKNLNKPILIVSLIFAVCGAFLILDSSSISSILTYGTSSPYYFFQRQIIFIVISIVASFFIIKYPTKLYRKTSFILSVLFMSIVTIIFLKNKLFSTSVNDVSIILFGFNFQPAEFLKIFLTMYMASYYDDWVNNPNHKQWGFIWPLIICGFGCLIILLGGDFGSAALMLALFATIFLFLPCKEKYVLITKTIAAGGLILCVLLLKFSYVIIPKDILESDYRLNRFIYKDACDRYEENSGYQVCNGYIAIDNGGMFGTGIGESVQKYLYLPASHTDFIFPIIVEELGVIVGIIIIIGYMYLIYQIFKLSSTSSKLQNSMLSFGIGIYFMLHIFINLGGVLGIIPLTGVPLPFLSYGGSFCVSLICSFAVLQRINIENNISRMK